ncbi:MAG: outer membrane lipoprotein carrier protein LolA [Bryobacteraceae bacterium]
MSPFRLLLGLLAVSVFAGDAGVDRLLKGVETRYNRAKTLQVLFHEEYTPPGPGGGPARRSESGRLVLQKPGRMRWDYSQPKGKLFISDGKFMWLYTPSGPSGHPLAEKIKVQESEDMRAPLAFLLGKLNFEKEFRNLQVRPEGAGGGTRITAEPKTDNLPYSAVEFVVTVEDRIREVKVTGFDNSILDFTFDDESLNPRLNGKLFQFQAPPGAELVDGGA